MASNDTFEDIMQRARRTLQEMRAEREAYPLDAVVRDVLAGRRLDEAAIARVCGSEPPRPTLRLIRGGKEES